MKYYARLTGPHHGGHRVYAEIWQVELIEGSSYDKIIQSKKFWSHSSARKWVEKRIMKLIMKDKLQHFFIKDEDIIREEM